MGLPAEWIEHLEPPASMVVVERDERPLDYKGLILLPPSVQAKTKSSAATVIAAGWKTGLYPGERVMVAAGVGRRLKFGERDERVLYVCWLRELIGVVRGETTVPEEEGSSPFRAPGREGFGAELDEKHDEGVRRAR